MSKYFGVIYSKDGTIHLTAPYDTQEECLNKLRQVYESKWKERVKRTTVIKRDVSGLKDSSYIFGSPNSLNVVR